MFGVLTVIKEPWNWARAAGSRLQPGAGISFHGGQFRMAMFRQIQLRIPEDRPELARQRVLRGLTWLRQQKVSPVLVPEEYETQALACGLEPVRREPALQACAGQIAEQAARALGLELRQVCLLVCGSQISQEGQMQLLSLAVTAGAVRLQEPRCEALRSRLWRSCGVVPEGAVPPGLTPVALLFPGGQPPRAALTADLTGEGTCESGLFWRPGLLPPEGAMASLPQNADPAGFAAILWRCGAIQAREIRVPHLDIRPAAPYNNELVTDFDLHNLQDTGGTFHAKTIQIDC